MQPWLMMFKKDLRMSKLSLIGFCVLIAVSLLFVSISYTNERGSAFAIGLMAMLMGPIILYFPVHLLLSLRHEWHKSAPIWLHTPISGYGLLLSKAVVGLIYFLACLIIMILFGYWISQIGLHRWIAPLGDIHAQTLQSLIPDIWTVILFGLLGIVAIGIYMGVWAALISVSMQSVKNQWSKFSLLLGVIIFLIPTWGFAELSRVSFLRQVLRIGQIDIPFRVQISSTAPMVDHVGHLTLYTGTIIAYVLVVSVVFYLTGWLLDKKVEV